MDAHSASTLPMPVALAAALLLVVANGMFVAAEFAMVRARPSRLEALAREGNRRAARALAQLRQLDDGLSVCQVGITLASLALGWLGEPAFGALFALAFDPLSPWIGPAALSLSLGAAFLFITFLHVAFGETAPKFLAIAQPERILMWISFPLQVFWYVAKPLVIVLNGSAEALLRPFGYRSLEESSGHTLEDIRQLLHVSARQGKIGPVVVDLADNLVRFAGRRARDIMVPRARVVALSADLPPEEVLRLVREEGYSRYPVVEEGDLDRIVGILHVKDLFQEVLDRGGARPDFDLRKLARAPRIVPETLPVGRLLRLFQRDHGHMAVVADEYGGTAGIVTLEDVLEELVGELRDEFDAGEADEIAPLPGGGWRLDAVLPVRRAAELVPSPPEIPPEVHTLAGYVQSLLGRIPRAGDRVPFGPAHELVVAVAEGPRILRLELRPVPAPPDGTDTPEA